jgi:hypothetical protein
MGNFKDDNKRGEVGAVIVRKLYELNEMPTCPVDPESEERKYWDLKTTLKNKTKILQEVKTDYREESTGNLAIEVDDKGKPSGITSTKAALWVEVLFRCGKPSVWSANTNKLRTFIKTNKPKKIVNAGDNNSAELHIYPCNQILPKIFTRIDNLDKYQLSKYLDRELNNDV